MWHKFLAAVIIAIIALFTLPAIIFADTSPSTVTMHGEAIIIPGARTTQIQMELTSSDVQVWFINLDLSIPVTERESDDDWEVEEAKYETISEDSNIDVRGYFTLGVQAQILTGGTVDGTLNSNGTGDIKLSAQDNSTSLNMIFTIAGSGAVTAVAEGQWPVIPALAPTLTPTPTPTPTPVAGISPVGPVPSAPPSAVDTLLFPPLQPANHFFWYLSRTSAIAAYILLFINVCMGIGLKTKYLDSLMRRWRTFDLHQFTAILGGSLIILHIFSLLGDSYFKFSVSELLVPMSSPYRPLWTALGSIGLYAGAVIALSFYIRRIIGQKIWRVLHYVSFVLFFTILFHGIMAGTDISITWVRWLYISTGTVATFLFLWRFFSYRAGQAPKADQARISLPEQPNENTVSS